MSLEIYGTLLSQPVRTVVTFCRLHDIAYNFHPMDLSKGDQRTEEFRRINPFETVPAIVHGDYNLWEAAAIITYLADAYSVDSHWYPKDLKKRGRINAYFHWHHSNTRLYCRALIFYTVVGPLIYGIPPATPEQEEKLTNDLKNFLSELDTTIGNGYITGDEMNIADIFAFNEIVSLKIRDFDHSSFANVSRWFAEIEQIPEVREHFEVLIAFVNRVKGGSTN